MMTTTPKTEADPNGSAPKATSAHATNVAMVLGTDAYRGALEPASQAQTFDLAELMVSANQFGLKNVAEGVAKIMFGRNLGIPAMQALQSLHSIESKIGVAADMLQALCLKSPLCEYFEPLFEECDANKATFRTKRVGRPEMKFTFTIEEAEAMGVLDRGKDEAAKKKNNWVANRKRMLEARSKATLAKLVYPDVTQGLYSTEELDAMRDEDPDELVGEVVPNAAAAAAPSPVQAAKRDFAKEAEALKDRIRDAGASRQAVAEIREAITAWDGIEPWKGQVASYYNEIREERKKAAAASTHASPAEPAATTTAASPGLMPEGNLFAGTDPAKDGSK